MAGCHFCDHPTYDCNAFLFLTLKKTVASQEGPSGKELKADFGQETEVFHPTAREEMNAVNNYVSKDIDSFPVKPQM